MLMLTWNWFHASPLAGRLHRTCTGSGPRSSPAAEQGLGSQLKRRPDIQVIVMLPWDSQLSRKEGSYLLCCRMVALLTDLAMCRVDAENGLSWKIEPYCSILFHVVDWLVCISANDCICFIFLLVIHQGI